jgi:DNA-binding transcriptional regulator LsrR (DeoR family)
LENASQGNQVSGRERLVRRDTVLDYEEIVSIVCMYFCGGYLPSQIADLMRIHYGIEMKREAPYKYIQYAASKNWLRFTAANEDYLTQKVRKQFPWLQQAEVVHTGVFEDVAQRTAEIIVELLRAIPRSPQPKDEVHIGFAGGYAMRTVAEKLAGLLKEPTGNLPGTLILHSLVAGFDVNLPLTDPNSFFTYFSHQAIELQLKMRFVLLHAPAIVQPGRMQEILELPGIIEAYQSIDTLDIIVTSASSLSDRHFMLHRYYANKSEQMLEMLKRDGCVGDMLWLPLAPTGPIDMSTYQYRTMTLVELQQLPRYIGRGTRVILALAPCNLCAVPKTDILRTILNLKDHLITHLVLDSRTGRELFEDSR